MDIDRQALVATCIAATPVAIMVPGGYYKIDSETILKFASKFRDDLLEISRRRRSTSVTNWLPLELQYTFEPMCLDVIYAYMTSAPCWDMTIRESPAQLIKLLTVAEDLHFVTLIESLKNIIARFVRRNPFVRYTESTNRICELCYNGGIDSL
jgi:hypothetical protein